MARIWIEGVPIDNPQFEDPEEARQAFNEWRAANPEQAEQLLARGASTKSAQEALKARADELGLSPQDLQSIARRGQRTESGIAAGGHMDTAAEETGALQKFGLGVAREAQRTTAGLESLVVRSLNRVAPGVAQGLGMRELDELVQKEQEAKELFEMVDRTGVGTEDAGQMLAEVLQFVGGGSLATGAKVLATLGRARQGAGLLARTTTSGAIMNTLQSAANDTESNVKLDAALGGALGAVSTMVVGAVPGVRRLARNAPASLNMMASLIALNRGNTAFAASTAGRAAWQVTTSRARIAAQTATNPQQAAALQQANVIARGLRDSLGTTISVLRQQYQGHAAVGYAQAAYQNSVRSVGGRTFFDASRFNRQLAQVTDKELSRMGIFGQRLSDIRQVAKVLEDVGDQVDHRIVPQILESLSRNPEARRLLPQLTRAKRPETQLRLLRRLVQMSPSAVAHEAMQSVGSFAQDNPLM